MASHPVANSPRSWRNVLRRRPIAATVAGVTVGASLLVAAGLSSVLPGLNGSASANTALSGVVYLDENFNGVKDGSETSGVSGVTVTAYDAVGATAGSALTVASGAYAIDAAGSGPYRVEFTGIPVEVI